MVWQQVIIHCSRQEADDLAAQLNLLDAGAVTLSDACDQAVFQEGVNDHPLWDQVIIKALFEEAVNLVPVIDFLQNFNSSLVVIHEILPAQNWERACLDSFKPLCFAGKLWVCPSWHARPDSTPVLLLDPGLAFGTGTHETTHLCLEWLATQDITNKVVVDYGCGSGILALAAATLGAREIWAVDTDPQALAATRANAQLNNMPVGKLHTLFPEELPEMKADIVIANILLQALIDLSPKLANLSKQNSPLVLSGVLAAQEDSLTAVYEKYYTIQSVKMKSEWILWEGTRK